MHPDALLIESIERNLFPSASSNSGSDYLFPEELLELRGWGIPEK
jgi:hypothetical protein